MSLEQVILLVFFVLIPLAQTIAGALKQRRAAQPGARRQPEPQTDEAVLEAWPAPAVKAPSAGTPLFSARLREPAQQAAARVAPVSKPTRAPAAVPRAQRLRRVPRNPAQLRDALALAVILGPPRALDRSER